MMLLLTFVRDEVIERGAALVGMDPIRFCMAICGVFLVGSVTYMKVMERRIRAANSQLKPPE